MVASSSSLSASAGLRLAVFLLAAALSVSAQSGNPYQALWNNYDCETFIVTGSSISFEYFEQPDVVALYPPEVLNGTVSLFGYLDSLNLDTTEKLQPYMDVTCPLVRNTSTYFTDTIAVNDEVTCTYGYRSYGLIVSALFMGILALVGAFVYGRRVGQENGLADQSHSIFLGFNCFLFLSGVLIAGSDSHTLGAQLILLSCLGAFCSQSNHSAAFFVYFIFAAHNMLSLIGHNQIFFFSEPIWEFNSGSCNDYFGYEVSSSLPAPIPAQSVNGLMYCNVEGVPMTCSLVNDAFQVRCGDCQYLVTVAVFGYFSSWICSFTAIIAFVETFIGRSWGMAAK